MLERFSSIRLRLKLSFVWQLGDQWTFWYLDLWRVDWTNVSISFLYLTLIKRSIHLCWWIYVSWVPFHNSFLSFEQWNPHILSKDKNQLQFSKRQENTTCWQVGCFYLKYLNTHIVLHCMHTYYMYKHKKKKWNLPMKHSKTLTLCIYNYYLSIFNIIVVGIVVCVLSADVYIRYSLLY